MSFFVLAKLHLAKVTILAGPPRYGTDVGLRITPGKKTEEIWKRGM
jgi:hypothetical protein